MFTKKKKKEGIFVTSIMTVRPSSQWIYDYYDSDLIPIRFTLGWPGPDFTKWIMILFFIIIFFLGEKWIMIHLPKKQQI